jgi:hypothetical protein
MAAIPVASFIAGPLSGVLLQMNGIAGFKGWQWMFIVEGVPSVILGLVVLKFLTDAPDKATWFKPEQRDWLVKEMAAEAGSPEHHSLKEVLGTLISWKVMRLALVYFGLTTGLYGIELWMPQMLQSFGLSDLHVGFVGAIPYHAIRFRVGSVPSAQAIVGLGALAAAGEKKHVQVGKHRIEGARGRPQHGLQQDQPPVRSDSSAHDLQDRNRLFVIPILDHPGEKVGISSGGNGDKEIAKGQTQCHSQISRPSVKSFAMALWPNFFHMRRRIFRTAIRTVALLATIPNNRLPASSLHERYVQKCVLPVFAARTHHSGVFWMSRAFSLAGNAYHLAPASRKLAPR